MTWGRLGIAMAILVVLALLGLIVYATLFGAQCSGVVIDGNHVTPFTCPGILH